MPGEQPCSPFFAETQDISPTKDIPVIISTAAVQAMREQEATLQEKGIPLIYKPFDVDELLRVIRQLLPSPPET